MAMNQWTCDIGHWWGEPSFELQENIKNPSPKRLTVRMLKMTTHGMRFHYILGVGKVVKDGKGILMLTCLVSWSVCGPGPILGVPASISGWMLQIPWRLFELLDSPILKLPKFRIKCEKKNIQIWWQMKKNHPWHRSLSPSFTALKVSMMISPRANLACPLMSAAREV